MTNFYRIKPIRQINAADLSIKGVFRVLQPGGMMLYKTASNPTITNK